MPLTTAILLKLAASAGIATVSELLKSAGSGEINPLGALNSVLGGVATGFTQQFSSQLDYDALARFVQQKSGDGFEALNHDIEKLMVASVPAAFRTLKASYEEQFGKVDDVGDFFDLLIAQAEARPNDATDYKLMAKAKTEWFDKSRNYAWEFALEFAPDSKIDLYPAEKEHIKNFVTEHFDKAFELVFLEGLKDEKKEKPYKAFIIKSLRGLEEQVVHVRDAQEEIQKSLKAFEERSSVYLTNGRVYLDQAWVEKDTAFKELVTRYLKRIYQQGRELGEKMDEANNRLGTLENIVVPQFPKFLTATVGKFEAGQYVERGHFLEELRADLLKDKDSILVNGLGGVGKSTLAAAYVKRYEEDYDHIAWLEQTDTFEAMLLSQTSLLENLEITPEGIAGAELPRVIFQKMAAVPGKRKLLVLDNVGETLRVYKDLLPAGYHILLTSREKLRIGFPIKEVGKLNREEASELIGKCLTRMTPDVEEIRVFCEQVDYHALTIELLAKTLEESLELKSMTELTEHLRSNRWDAAVLQEDVFTAHGRAETQVYQHLLASFTLAKLDEEEKWTLLQLAVLPPVAYAVEDLSEWTGVELGKILKTLERKGWIHRTGNAFVMHRMVQVLVGRQVPPDEENVHALLDTFTKKLSIDYATDNPVDRFQWVGYGLSIAEALQREILFSSLSLLYNNLATVLQDLGDHHKARALLEKAVESDVINFGEFHPNTSVRYSNLAKSLRVLGKYERARTMFEKALLSIEMHFGEHHPTMAVRYLNLAMVFQDLGDYREARKLLEKAVQLDEKNFGEFHPYTSISYSNLAMVLSNLGDYHSALELMEKSIASDEKNLGRHHPNISTKYLNLATVLIHLGENERARRLMEEALDIDVRNFGEFHPNTARSYSNLATSISKLGDYEGSRVLYEKAIISNERNFGEFHPVTAGNYANLGTLLDVMGDPCNGLAYVVKAYEVFVHYFDSEHPHCKQLQLLKEHLSSKCSAERAE